MLTTNARIVHAEQSIMRQFDSRPTVANTQVDTVQTPELMYGAGLRLMECLCLRVQDIDCLEKRRPWGTQPDG
jgi:site-specific recombinase XerC